MIKEKTLTLLFLRQNDEVLLAMKKRGFGAGRWNGVGGKVESDETILEALVRETEEEIFVTPVNPEKVAEITFDEYLKGERTLMHVHIYTATSWKGEPAESEEMRPQWFHERKLPYDTMWNDDPYWLPQVLAGQKITASFTLDERDTIISHTVTEVKSFDS